jgi:tetratricopeptide (TPR) repeat protein
MRRLALALLTVTAIAHGQPAPPDDEAGTTFREARELAKAGRYAEACPLFERSYALDAALGTAVNLADCLERQGQLRRAWELFDLVARGSQQVASRAKLARDRADALAKRLATVIVTVHEPRLELTVGARALPAGVQRTVVDPGTVEVRAARAGRPAFHATLEVAAGAEVIVDVPAPVTETRRRRSRVYLAGGVAAGGAVGLGVALGLAASARQLNNGAFADGLCQHGSPPRCTAEGAAQIDRAGARADLATGFAIGGAVLAAAGIALFVTAPREPIEIAPIASGRALGLGVVAHF